MGLVVRRVGSFSYTPRVGNCLVFRRVENVSVTPLAVIFLVARRVGSFSYTPRDGICLVVRQWGSLSCTPRSAICLVAKRTRPALESVPSFVGWGISLTRPVLVCLVFGLCEFLLYTVLLNLSVCLSEG